MEQPWKGANAADKIRHIGRGAKLDLSYSIHFKERLSERDLTMADVLYLLKNGFVYDAAEPATQPGLFKYKMNQNPQFREPDCSPRRYPGCKKGLDQNHYHHVGG